ncbi:MAG: hypothetical protein LWX07_08825 [Bacteroidetes bacterium]|nr:hypothetical protein [Bacteroidota bacterium]
MKKILIIEDDINLRKEISGILRLEGFDVKESGDGREGLESVESYG